MNFLTVNEIAKTLRLQNQRVYEAIRRGLLPAVRIGRQVRVEEQALREWVNNGGQRYPVNHHKRAS